MRKPLLILSQLFLSFMKVGLFTFGGGYAMISVITDTCVEKKRWLTQDEMMDLTVVAESTPGPIAINCATYVGYKMAGMTGAVLATLGIVFPSFVILYIISMFLEHFLEYKMIAAACRGIKVGVSLLILDAGLTMLKKMKKKPQPRIIAGCAFCHHAAEQPLLPADLLCSSDAGSRDHQPFRFCRKGRTGAERR